MNWVTALVILVPSVLSFSVSLVYAYIALKKAKEPPKDVIWETTTRILCANGDSDISADDFGHLYEELWFFMRHRDKLRTGITIREAMDDYREKHPLAGRETR